RRRLIRRCRRTAGGNVHAPRRTGLDVIAIRSLGQGQRLPSLSPLRRRQCRDTAQPAVKLRHVHGSLLASQESAIADTNNQRHESLFHRVISFLFYTHTAEIRGVYCAQCARRRSLKESAICWPLGWWSIVGVFQTPVALLRNLLLGDKPRLPNARLLLTQGLHFNQQRQFALAHACFAQGKAFADGEILGTLQAAQEAVPSEPSGVLKDQWTWRSAT